MGYVTCFVVWNGISWVFQCSITVIFDSFQLIDMDFSWLSKYILKFRLTHNSSLFWKQIQLDLLHSTISSSISASIYGAKYPIVDRQWRIVYPLGASFENLRSIIENLAYITILGVLLSRYYRILPDLSRTCNCGTHHQQTELGRLSGGGVKPASFMAWK